MWPSSRMRTSLAVLWHLDGTATGSIGYAVEIAVDGDHAVAGDAPLQPQHGLERSGRKRLQAGALLGEMLADHAMGGGVDADVGHLVEPLAELVVEVAEIAKAAAEEEVFANVAERPLHLALGFGSVGLAGFGSHSADSDEAARVHRS